MALPLLKDFLPQDRPYAGVPEETATPDFLNEHEAKLIRAEQTAAALCQAIERFASAIREALPSLSEDNLVSAYEQIQAEDEAHRPFYSMLLEAAQGRRARVAKLKSSPTRARALQFCDREILLLKRTIAAFESAKEKMESFRDAVLVREAQEFSGRAFWGEDDE